MAEDYFDLYCELYHITDPFEEDQERFSKRVTTHHTPSGGTYWEVDMTKTEEDIAWEVAQKKKKNEYLRLEHIFRLWEFHDRLNWDDFQREIESSKHFTDDWKRYLPCDCAGRQCNMWCAYFGTECPRKKGEPLWAPEEVMKVWDADLEDRWEDHDDLEP